MCVFTTCICFQIVSAFQDRPLKSSDGQKLVEKMQPIEVIANAVSNYTPIRREANGVGPVVALKRLMVSTCTVADKRKWVEKARVASLLGSCPDSHKSLNNRGTKLWAAFAKHTLDLDGREFPPPLHGLLAWAALFRHPKTFSNYLGYVRLGCHVLGVSDAVFSIQH